VVHDLKFLFLFVGKFKDISLKSFQVRLVLGGDGLNEVGERRVLVFAEAPEERIERAVKGLNAEDSLHAFLHVVGMLGERGHFIGNGSDLAARGIELGDVRIGGTLRYPLLGTHLIEHGEKFGGVLRDSFEGFENLGVGLRRDLSAGRQGEKGGK
jgi:hypothetical protein